MCVAACFLYSIYIGEPFSCALWAQWPSRPRAQYSGGNSDGHVDCWTDPDVQEWGREILSGEYERRKKKKK